MHTTASLLFTSLLILATSALPASPQPGADQCGPTVSNPSDPPDTCHSAPTVLPDERPTSFGITKVPIPERLVVAGHWDVSCNAIIDQVCETMATAEPNNWYFVSATNSACELGFWLPGGDDAAPNPALKDTTQCKNVYTAMIDALTPASTSFMGATVNLVVPPANQKYQSAPLLNGDSTGQAVNAGYPSYYLSGRIDN